MKPTILIVDDMRTNRVLLGRILEHDLNIEEAADGVEALEKMRTLPEVACVILDILMPQMDGYGVLAEMKNDPKLQDIPVIVVTAAEDIESQIKALELRSEVIFYKPVNPQLLNAQVANVLERHEIQRQRNAAIHEYDDNQARLQAVLDDTSAGVSVVESLDLNGRNLFANDHFYALFGFTRDQYESELPNGMSDLIYPDDLDEVQRFISENLHDSDSCTCDCRAFRRDGSLIHIRLKCAVIPVEGYEKPLHFTISSLIED